MEELRKQTETLPLAPPGASPTPMPLPLSPAGPTTVPGAPTGEDRLQQLIREAAQRRDGAQPSAPIAAPDPKAAMDAFIAMQGAAPPDLGIPEFMPTVTPRPRLTPQQHGARLQEDVIAPWELLDVFSETGWELTKQIPKIATGRWDELEAPTLFSQESYLAGEKASIEAFQSRPWWQQIILGIAFDPFGPPIGAGTAVATTRGLLKLATRGVVKGAGKIPFRSRQLAVELLEETEDGIKIKPDLEKANPEIIQESVNNMPPGKIAFIYGIADEDAGAYVRFFDEADLAEFQRLEADGLGVIQYKGQNNVTDRFRTYRERVNRMKMDEEAAVPYERAPGPEVVPTPAPGAAPQPAPTPARAPARADQEPLSLAELEDEYIRLDPRVGELEQQAVAVGEQFTTTKRRWLNSFNAFFKQYDDKYGQIQNSVLNRLFPTLRLAKGGRSSFEVLDPLADEWNRQLTIPLDTGPEGKVLIDNVIEAIRSERNQLADAIAIENEARAVKQEFTQIKRRMRGQGIKEGVGAIDQPRLRTEGVVDEFVADQARLNITEIDGPSGYLALPIQMAKENNPAQLLHPFGRLVRYQGNDPDGVMDSGVREAWEAWIDQLGTVYNDLVGTDDVAARLVLKIDDGLQAIPIDSLPTRQVMKELDNLLESIRNGLDYTPPGGAAPSPAAAPTPGETPGPVTDWLPIEEPLILDLETGLFNGAPLAPGDILMRTGMQRGGWTPEEAADYGYLIRVLKVSTDDPITHGNLASGVTWSQKDPRMRSGFVTYEQLGKETGLPEKTFSLSLNPLAKADRSLGHMYNEVYRVSRSTPTPPSPAAAPRVRVVPEDKPRRVRIVEEQPHPAEPVIIPSTPSTAATGIHRVYHGTSQVFDAFTEGAQSIDSLYGPGVYLTENSSVASRYAVTTGTRGPVRNYSGQAIDATTGRVLSEEELAILEAGGAPNVWSVDIHVEKFFDIDAVPDKEIMDYIRQNEDAWADGFDWANLDIKDIETNHDLYQVMRGQFGNKAEVNDWLIARGFDSITHIGGARTNTAPHRVWIALSGDDTPGQVIPAWGTSGPDEYIPPPSQAEIAPKPPVEEQAPGAAMQQGFGIGEEAPQGTLDMGAAGRGVEQPRLEGMDPDQIAKKIEINDQRKQGQMEFDDMEGLAQLARINGEPGTQYFLEVNYGRPTPFSTETVDVRGVSRTRHAWQIRTDMVESRRAFQQAGNLEEFNFQEEVVGWITKFDDEDIYRIHHLDIQRRKGAIGTALGNGKSLQGVMRGVVWDVNNNRMAIKMENGDIMPFGEHGGGGGSWRRRHARADYTGESGQLRLHRDINEAILDLRKRKRLLERIAGEANQPPRAVARMRAQIAQEAERLTALLNNMVDVTYQQITTVPPEQIRRAAYAETSAVTAVPATERSGLLIARGAEAEMQGMGRNVTEQALEAQQRLGDHRYTKQLLEQVIRDQEEGWEETVSIIRQDLEDEANALGILADLMAEEGSDAARGLVRGLRDEIYDEIGTVDPKFQGGWGSMYEQAGGGRTARPSGGWPGSDPELDRQLDAIMERAAQNGERVQYQGAGPMADDEIGRFADSPPPPRIPTIVSEPGQGFIRLPNVRHIREFLMEDIVDENNPVVQWIYQYTPMNWVDKSVNAITPAAKLKIAYMMAQVADDQYLEVVMQAVWDAYAKSAPRTFFGKRITGPLRKLLPGTGIMDIPINWKTGSWGDSGIQWNDIWENYNGIHKAHVDKYADRLDGKMRHLIAEFANIVNTEVEKIRKVNGLTERRRLRPVSEVYMPRKGVRKYDEATKRYYNFEKPSNPNHERLWMTAQDVYEKHGIDFLSDPRAVLELHVRQALKEVRHHQMEEMIEELGFAVKVSELVDPAIVSARADALGAWQAAQKALKAAVRAEYGEELQTRIGKLIADMNIDLGLDADISRAQAALRAERGTVRADLAGEVLRLTADESRAKIAFYQARQNYRKAINRARDREYIQLTDDHSPLWGGTLKAGIHPITPNRFKTKFFLTEDAQHIEAFIKGLDPDNAGVAATTFNTLANTSRFIASVGDFAMPFQHLLPVMWRRPDAWVNATFNHYRAWWDPTVQARLVRDNIDDYWELALNGVPVGDPEFFAALSPGQGIDFDAFLRRIEAEGPENMNSAKRAALQHAREGLRLSRGVGRQTLGRFQTSYQTGLGFSRVLLYKALKNNKKWAGNKNELFSYIRNMTGGLDSRRLGIGPTQRGIEGMWIAFSPRLLRSTLALTSDAIQAMVADPGVLLTGGFGQVTGRASARQTESFNTIRNMIAGVFGLYTLAGLGMGKDWDEIKQGMNPLNGRRFLSYQINGDWIGVGGQMRALMQFSWSVMGLLSGQRGEFSDLMSTNMMKNPFVYFFMSRGAPGITLGGTAIEAATDDIDILPFDDPDGPLDFVTHYMENSAPFALQHFLESRTWESAVMEMFGARASFNPRDRAVSYITGGEESVYADQPPMIKWMVNELVDDGTSTFDNIEMKRRKELLSLPRSGLSYMQWKSVEDKFSGRRGQAAEEEDFGKNDINDPDPMKRAMAQYYELFRHPRVRDAEGISMPNGDEIFSRLFRAKANLAVEQGGWGWTVDQAKHVIANTNRRPVPWFVLSQVSGARKDSIIRSQRMREQMFIEMGRKDLAMISHRLFYMLPPEQGAYSESVDRLVEGGPHDFGPYMYDEAWGHQEQRLEDIQGAGGAQGLPNVDIERIVAGAR